MNQWDPLRPDRREWELIRKAVLGRDDHTCACCGHRASKWMNIHHLEDGDDNRLDNLCTLCVACHAVMHMGLSLQVGTIEIWKAAISQVEIVRATREGVRSGKTLAEINAGFGLKKGRRDPDSCDWGNALLRKMGPDPRAELPKPLCAVFVDLKRWQLEP